MTLEERLTFLRESGYMLAVHNDYRLNGKLMTFCWEATP